MFPGCGRPTQRSAGKGLNEVYCKVHTEFHRRHGSYWHRSYLARELESYRIAARRWIRANRKEALVAAVIQALDGLLAAAGQPESAYDLRLLPATEKARIALARLREAAVPSVRFLEITLAVSARVTDRGPHDVEFLEVQIAKAVHGLASGTHRTSSGIPMRSKYAPSAGHVLRVLGRRIREVAGTAADSQAVDEVIALAQPGLAVAERKEAQRQALRDKIAREIERVRLRGMGPQRLREYRRELRKRYKL